MAWLAGWSYRKEITITGQAGAGTNYQVKFNIGDSAGGDFHLEGHCTNFPQDIEVTDDDGTTLLKFWIEDITADPLEMTVKVADDLGSNQTIYIYYGKSGATTNSNGPDTFISFPDSLADITESSNAGGTIVSYDSGTNTFTQQPDATDYVTEIWDNTDISSHSTWIIECDIQGQTGNTQENVQNGIVYISSKTYSADPYGSRWIDLSGHEYWRMTTSSGYNNSSADVGFDISTIHPYKLQNDGTNFKYYVNDVLKNTRSSSGESDTYAGMYATDITDKNRWTKFTNFRIRKYAATEPSFSSAGSEETAPFHTYDTAARVAPNNLNPMTVSVTPTTGATVLVLAIMSGGTTPRTAGTPTFNGENLTQIESTISATNEITVEMWYLIDPSIGTFNVSVPNANTRDISLIVSVYKARAGYTSAFDVSNSNTSGSTQNTSITVTPTVNGAVIVEAMGHGYSVIPSANNRTKLYSVDEGVWTDNHQYALQDTAAAIEFTWTVGGLDDLAQILVAFKEVTIPITGHPWYYERKQ